MPDKFDLAVDQVLGGGGAMPAAAPGAPDPLDAGVDQVLQDEQARRRGAAWRAANSDVPPEKAADVLRLAAATGADPQLVADQHQAYKAAVTEDQLAKVLEKRPGLAEYMQDPTRAALVRDDLPSLSALERWLGKWETTTEDGHAGVRLAVKPFWAQAFAQALAGREAGALTRREMAAGDLADAVKSQGDESYYDDLRAEAGLPPQSDEERAAQAQDVAQPQADLPDLQEALDAKPLTPEEQKRRADLEQQAAREVPVGNVVEESVRAIAGGLPLLAESVYEGGKGYLAAGPLGAALHSGTVFAQDTAPTIYRQMQALRADDGTQLLSDDEARTFAFSAAVASGALQELGGALFLRDLPGGRAALDKMIGGAVATAVGAPTWRAATGRFLAEGGKHVASGVAMMVAQSATSAAAVELSKPQADWGAVADAAKRGVWEGLLFAPLALWAPGRELLAEKGRIAEARADAPRIAEMAKAAAESKLVQRHPEEAAQLFGRLAQEGQSDTTYVTTEAWDSYWQGKGLDPAAVAARVVGDSGKAYADAKAAGADLRVPTAKWLVEMAPQGHADALREHVKLAEDGATLAQAKELAERLQKRVDELRKLKPEAQDAGQRMVYEDVLGKATAAKVKGSEAEAVAQQWAAFYAAQAERFGTTADELYRRTADLAIIRGTGDRPGAAPPDMARAAKLQQLELDPQRFPSARDISPEEARLARAQWDTLTQDQHDILWNHPDGNGLPPELEARLKEIADQKAVLGRRYFRSTLFERPVDGGATLRLNKEGERGYVEFTAPGSAGPRRFDIHLLENADRSTLAHETAHAFGEVLHDLAMGQDAPDVVRRDYEAMVRWMGYASGEERAAATQERIGLSGKPVRTIEEQARLSDLTAREEKLSHAWEQYLAEGIAPSRELASVFLRFKRWLAAIYRGVSNIAGQYRSAFGRELDLTPEVRSVFDRMLASEDQIAAARGEASASMLPLFEQKAPAEAAQGLRNADAAARAAAEAELSRRMAEHDAKTNEELRDAEAASIRADVEKELQASPVYRARDFLQDGTLRALDGTPLEGLAREAFTTEDGEPVKLDRAALRERYGEAFVQRLPRPWLRNGGMHPDTMAELFGFKSGDEMVRALEAAAPREQVIEQETQRRLAEKFPGLLDNPQRIAEAALDAVHDDTQLTNVVREARAMARWLDPSLEARARMLDVKVIKATAEQIINGSSYADLSPSYYLQAERAAAKKALDLAASGKVAEAFDAKEQQLLSMALYRLARDGKAEADRALNYLRRFLDDDQRAKLGKAGADYLQQVDVLLDGFELRKGVSASEMDRRAATQSWIENEQAAGRDPVIPDSVLRDLERSRHYRDLTLDGIRNLRDAVDNVAHLAELKRTLVDGKSRRDFDGAKAELLAALKSTQEAMPVRDQEDAAPALEQKLKAARKAGLALAKVEEFLRQLDGGRIDGPWTRLMWNPVKDGDLRRIELVHETTLPILRLLDGLPKEDLKRWQETRFDVNGQTYTLEAAMAVALNWGNASNRKKLVEGRSRPGVVVGKQPWTENTPREFLDRLTARDWQIVQQVWDSLESLWPESAALEKRMTGLEPPKVTPTPFTWKTADGETATLRGGYFPLIYDRRDSRAGEMQNAPQTVGDLALFNGAYQRAATPQGRLQARVESFVAPIRLSGVFSLIPKKVNEAAKDIAMREGLLSAHKILMDGDMKAALLEHVGQEGYDVLLGWLRDTANDVAIPDNGGSSAWISWSSSSRTRLSASIFAYNIGQTLQNLTGFSTAMRNVGPKWLGNALVEFARDRSKAVDFVNEKSAEMRARSFSGMHGVGDALQELSQKTGLGARFTEFGLEVFEATDKAVAYPTWLAAYRRALGEGMPEEHAVAKANQTVRLKVGSGSTVDKPALLRSPVGKLLAPMMGFAINQINQVWASVADARLAKNDGLKWQAVKILGATLGAIMAGDIASELATGKGPEDEDGDGEITATDWALWASRTAALAVPKKVPLLGTAIRAWESGRDVNLGMETRVLTSMAHAAKATGTLAVKAFGDDEISGDDALNAALGVIETVGYAKGWPVAQFSTTARYLRAVDSGKEDAPENPAQAALGVAFGPKQKGKLSAIITAE